MTGELTDQELKILVRVNRPLADVEEGKTQWSLGTVAISKTQPRFVAGFSSTLNHDSRFRKQHFDYPDAARRGWAIIFRAWDRSKDTGLPEEFFAGWVPPEREREAERWIRFLNRELRMRLVEDRERREGPIVVDDNGNIVSGDDES